MEIIPNVVEKNSELSKWRSGSQPVMPQYLDSKFNREGYDIYPCHALGKGKINRGLKSLAAWIAKHKQVVIDGFTGVFWDIIKDELEAAFRENNITAKWVATADFLKPEAEINSLVAPFMGSESSVWGTKCELQLADFYTIGPIAVDSDADVTIIIGNGAALFDRESPMVYLDLSKNELQLRMRAGSADNLGQMRYNSASEMYKRCYFVDWVVLNAHKKAMLRRIAVVADAQWYNDVNWSLTSDLYAGLDQLSKGVFRVKPWFEPGAWGGHWMKDRIEGLSQDEVNYAWSFELIVPENGLVFESDGNLLEVSFDFLMYHSRKGVMGKHAERFGDEFPIRFDFLDTWDGGNLSIQCHPSVSYIREQFGETITQDETYYILDRKEGAGVYIGFQESIDPVEFRKVLEESQEQSIPVDIEKYVQLHEAKKHDLFLIPNGTVHSAAAGNMVLEISATPYIFTFKVYDWIRLGLDGEPRPINIEHAFNNLNFERKGDKVQKELISSPVLLQRSTDCELWHIPTHAEHFYDVHRAEFDNEFSTSTNNACHVLMLVEGSHVAVKTADGKEQLFSYAETFVISAAAGSYTLINKGKGRAKVVIAFVKD